MDKFKVGDQEFTITPQGEFNLFTLKTGNHTIEGMFTSKVKAREFAQAYVEKKTRKGS